MLRAEELQNELICMCADRSEEIKRRNDMQVEWLRMAILDQGSSLVFAELICTIDRPQQKNAGT